ncbi:hypothetical protein ACFVHB_17320 [Kitasatospora sp. NPDC127111]|uniref:hypothetical protein n=1 Tax=Kitasatospora sp. NPDC127111 TaxID=3345363 RepID=UPI00362696DA
MNRATIVNPRPAYRPVLLVDPPPTGYLHIAAAVQPPREPGLPVPRSSPRKRALLNLLKSLADELVNLPAVSRATLYRAVVIPPTPSGPAPHRHAVHPARYDVVVLIETTSPERIAEVEATEPCQRLLRMVRASASDTHVMAARCVRQIADVDKSRSGLFLFNHFVADDPDVALDVWEHLAAWYAAETGLDNSTLLAPLGDTDTDTDTDASDADYVFVNHARWDDSLPRLFLRQFGKKTFRTFVLANLRANGITAMPVLYRRA